MPTIVTGMAHKCVGEEHEHPCIRLDPRERRWYWHVWGQRSLVTYCPHCGEKLEEPVPNA